MKQFGQGIQTRHPDLFSFKITLCKNIKINIKNKSCFAALRYETAKKCAYKKLKEKKGVL